MNRTIHASSANLIFRLVMLFCLLGASTVFARDEIKVYRVPKQVAKSTSKLPDGWTAQAPGPMRIASYLVTKDGKKADISVVRLPGQAGGDEANVNRWRGQVGLETLPSDEIQKSAEMVKIGELNCPLYDLVGKNSSNDSGHILAAISHREGMAWFFKMSGNPDLVASQKPAFIDFLKNFDFSNTSEHSEELPAGHPPLENSSLPPGHPDISSTPSAPAAPAQPREGQPQWNVPKGWKQIDGGQFLFAKFTIADKDGQAAVNVSTSVGDGGGLVGNVTRWRGQLGLGPLSEEELSKSVKSLKTDGGEASVVKMSGTDPRTGKATKLIGAIVRVSGQTWFYKLMGDNKIVDDQQDAFTKFVQTVKY